jgi:ABC-type protease/lipase transport system fused ATPase/permease subunit
MLAASIIIGRALAPAEQAIASWRSVVAARGAYRRLSALFASAPAPTAIKLPRPSGALLAERATFTPAGASEPVLNGVSFALQPGEMLALIGPSAAGKTTLARLLVGCLAPSAGHVRLDGAETSVWPAADRGQYVGYLPQDVELLDASVRENIARLGDASDEEVIEAARLAGVHETILRLTNGYETRIGAGGARLSGGQRQRIALARALFRNPPLLVLDEPNSGLDREGEEALSAALAELMARGASIVLIAHRPGALALADKVLLLRDGRVEAFGAREEMLSKLMPVGKVVPARRDKPIERRSAHG